jgi:hypothetical protein
MHALQKGKFIFFSVVVSSFFACCLLNFPADVVASPADAFPINTAAPAAADLTPELNCAAIVVSSSAAPDDSFPTNPTILQDV